MKTMAKKNKFEDGVSSIKGHVKSVSGILVSLGVASIMGNVMKEYKPEAKGIQKLLIKIGAAALTGMVIKSVSSYVDGEIDEMFDAAVDFAMKTDKKEELNDDDPDDQN